MVGEVIDVRVRCTGRPSLGVEERGGAGGKKGARPGGGGAPREGRAIGRREKRKKKTDLDLVRAFPLTRPARRHRRPFPYFPPPTPPAQMVEVPAFASVLDMIQAAIELHGTQATLRQVRVKKGGEEARRARARARENTAHPNHPLSL